MISVRRVAWLALAIFFVFGLGVARPTTASARTSVIHPRLAAAVAELDAARGPEVYTALREVWGTWDRADPAHVEAVVASAAADPSLEPSARVYANVLAASARRRRGDFDGGQVLLGDLGFVTEWLFVGPFDNENKVGLPQAYPPELELAEPLVPGRAFDGKERPVRWRALPPSAGGSALFDFGHVIRPREGVCGYATTFVHGDADRPISLWVGVTGAFKLFFNGHEVLKDEAYRQLDVDRMAGSVLLRKGLNRITMKVCGDRSAPQFMLRLADPTGVPLTTLKVSAAFTDSNEPMPEWKAPPASPVRGPIQAFDAMTAGEAAPARALAAYAQYLSTTGGDPESEHRARDLARRAAEREPTIDRLLLAGELAEDRNQSNRWVERAAARVGPGQDNLEVLSAQAMLARSGVNWRDAVPIYERMVAADPDHIPGMLGLVDLYVRAGLKRTALHTLERAVARQPQSIALLRVYAAQLRALGRDTEATEVEARYAALRFDDPGYLNGQLELALARKDSDGAERWLARLLRTEGDATWAYGVAAQTYQALGQPARAQLAYTQALELAPEDIGTLRALSDLHGIAGDTAEQLQMLRRILELYPQAKEVREYVEHIEPPKPRADEAYAWAPERFLKMRDAATGRYPKRTLRNLTVTTVFDNGLASRFRQIVFQPLTDEAAAAAREYGFQYEGDRQNVRLRAARVFRADGKVDEAIESGEGAANNPSIAMYTSVRTFYVRFPRLNVGDIVELRYRVEDAGVRNEMDDYFGEVQLLQSDEPIKSSEYVLITPKARKFYHAVSRLEGVKHETKVDGDQRIDRFIASDVPPVVPEPAMPPWSEVLGKVHISTFASWDAMGSWYWGLVRDQFDVDDEVRRIARRLTDGLTSDEEKVRAVYGYATELRYVALEFGIEGILPRRCALTLARGWGDCKDKATLIVTMLRELGIDSTIVLVRTGMRGDTETQPASLAPFDHAIAYVPSMDLYLDGTAEGSGSRELPAMDRGSIALQINAGKPKLVRIPQPGPDESVASRTVGIRLERGGAAQFEMSYDITGVNAPQWRKRYHADGTRRERAVRDLAQELGPVELSPGANGITVSDLGDIEKPVNLSFRGRAPSFGRPEGSGISVPVAPQPELGQRFGSLSTRTHDVVVGVLLTRSDQWSVQIPNGFKVVALPNADKRQTPFGEYALEVEQAGDRIVVRSHLVLKSARIKVADYPAFRSFCEQADRAFAQRLVVEPR